MKNSKIGFGILGSGAASKIHIDAINEIEDSVIVDFFSPDPKSSEELIKTYGLNKFGSYEEMISAVRNGTQIISDAYSGMKTVELICAVYESSNTGETIYLD